jgi:thiamine phosphate synthase YjbQ (UPF0047 family)
LGSVDHIADILATVEATTSKSKVKEGLLVVVAMGIVVFNG